MQISVRKLFVVSFSLLSIGFFVVYAVKNFNNIPPLIWNASSLLVSLISVTLVVLNIGIGGTIWFLLLKNNKSRLCLKQVQIIFLISQFGKYLPGNIGQHLGRVVMAREIGIPLSIALNTMIIEVLWGAGVAAGLGLLSMLAFSLQDKMVSPFSIGLLPLSIGVAALLLLPWIGIGLLNHCFPKLLMRYSVEKIDAPKLSTAIFAAALFLLCFLITGLILKLQAQWLFGVVDGNLFELTGVFAIVWLAGYLTPGAPGGLGVREAMMVLLLSPLLGGGAAVGIGATLRVTTTIGDAVAFASGIVMKNIKIRTI